MVPTVATNVSGRDLIQPALDTLPSNIAILDAEGRILVTNSSWRAFAEANDIQMSPGTVDVNYLDIAEAADDAYADHAVTGLQAVLRGERDQFELEYPCHSPDEKRWFLLRAAGFTHDGARYATVAHVDITERRQRELALREAYEISVSDRPFSEKVDALLALGREILGLAFGTLSHVQDEEYTFEAVATPDGADLSEGETAPLSTLPNCERVVETGETLELQDVQAETPELLDPEWGITAYLGAPVVVDGEVQGTFCFYSTEARAEEFSEWEVTFVELFSEWVSNALERRHYTDLLSALETSFPELAFLIDAEGTYLDYLATPTMRDRLVEEPDELLGQMLHDVLPTEPADQLLATVRKAIDTGDLQTVEYKLDVPAGTRWFEGRVAPVINDEYGPDTVVFVARDITERRTHEQELRETSEMLKSVQQTMASADPLDEKLADLLTFGQAYLDVEKGFFAQIDDERLEIRVTVGPNDQLQAGDSIPLSQTYCRHTIDADTTDLLVVESASDEGWTGDPAFERFGLECYIGATVVVDGEVEGTICFADRKPAAEGFTDPQLTFIELVSEWIGSELSQREQKRQYRQLTNRISDAYYALDADWTVTYWNDAIADRVGVPAEEIVGENFWEYFPEIEESVYGNTLFEAVQSQKPQSCEFYYEEGDYWVNVWAYPDEKGISVISQEITERKEHEQELAEHRDELADLDRLNTLVRELMQALQDTDSRKAIETAVCDRLTESALYQSAWIGVRGANASGDQTVIPQITAGIEAHYLDGISDVQGPATAAVQTGDIQIVDDIATAAEFPDERRQRALEYGHHALAAIPLATGDMTYGVLVVYLPEAQTISDSERTVLADLGQMIGQAIQRVHSQQALNAEAVVTIDLQIPDTDLVVGDASVECGCELILEQQITTGDAGSLYYFSVHDTDPEDVCRFLRETPLNADCTVVREADDDRPPLIEFHLADHPDLPTDVVQNYGGSVRTARITDGDIYLSIELPPTVDVRTVVDALRAVATGIERLLAVDALNGLADHLS